MEGTFQAGGARFGDEAGGILQAFRFFGGGPALWASRRWIVTRSAAGGPGGTQGVGRGLRGVHGAGWGRSRSAAWRGGGGRPVAVAQGLPARLLSDVAGGTVGRNRVDHLRTAGLWPKSGRARVGEEAAVRGPSGCVLGSWHCSTAGLGGDVRPMLGVS